MKHVYEYQNQPFTIDMASGAKIQQAAFGGKTVTVELLRADGPRLDLLIDGQPCSAFVTSDGDKRWVTVNGQTLLLVSASGARRVSAHPAQSEDRLTAQMAGLVRAVMVAEGQPVKKGQTLAVIEAMKMENKLSAPFDGVVKTIKLKVGQSVERDQLLVEISKIE